MRMTLAIMQPYFFPYIGYWQLVNAVDTFVIYDDVSYIKKGYINRNSILINSEVKAFTLELIGASQNKLINDINIGHNREKIIKTIEMAYRKASYFNEAFPVIKKILENKEENLAKYVGNSLELLSEYFLIKTKFIYSSAIEKDNSLRGEEKILHIAQLLNANNYVNAIGGQELYEKNIFNNAGIHLNFLKTEIVEYKQNKNDFVPYLSIIDIMMFNSAEDIGKMMTRYELL